MLRTEYCDIQSTKLTDNMPKEYKNLLLSNYIIYNKIKTLCTLIPNLDTKERDNVQSIIDKLITDWQKNDLECSIMERTIKPVDEYNREFRFTTNNIGGLTLNPASNPSEEVLECPSNTDFDPYEFVAINLQPKNKMFVTEYIGQNPTVNYDIMNYKLAKNSIQDEDRVFN